MKKQGIETQPITLSDHSISLLRQETLDTIIRYLQARGENTLN